MEWEIVETLCATGEKKKKRKKKTHGRAFGFRDRRLRENSVFIHNISNGIDRISRLCVCVRERR